MNINVSEINKNCREGGGVKKNSLQGGRERLLQLKYFGSGKEIKMH